MKVTPQEAEMRRAVLEKVAASGGKQAEISVGFVPGLRLIGFPSGRIAWGLRCRDPRTGRKPRIPVGDGDMASAIAEAHKILASMKAGLSLKASRLTVSQFFDEQFYPWALEAKAHPKDDLGRFNLYVRPAIGTRPLANVEYHELYKLVNNLPSRLSIASKNRIAAVVKSVFRRAVKVGLLELNPAAQISMETENNERDRTPSVAELEAIARSIEAEPKPSLAGLLWQLILCTGMRLTEALSAKYEYIDGSGRILILPSTKNGDPRPVPLSDEALSVIQELAAIRRNEYLFPGRDGGHMSRPTRSFNRILKRAGVSGLWFHDGRRYAGTVVANATGSIYDVASLLGHRDINVAAARYAVPSHDRLLATAQVISEHLRAAAHPTSTRSSVPG